MARRLSAGQRSDASRRTANEGRDTVVTEDGQEVGVGDRIYNYYDGKWGEIVTVDEDGWCSVRQDDGSTTSLDGSRMSTYDPRDQNPNWPLPNPYWPVGRYGPGEREASRRTASVVDESYIRRFTDAYVDTELWSSSVYLEEHDESPVPADELDATVYPGTMQAIANVCRDFVEGSRELLEQLHAEFPQVEPEQCGHDFSLTRNGHGAGFWDRGYGAIGDALSDASRPYGETYWYLVDGELFSDGQ